MNRKFTTLTVLAMVVTLTAVASVPAGYYNSIVGKSGKDLKDAIHTLIAPHTALSYNALWRYFYETDMKPNTNKQVWDMYSNNEYFFTTQGASVSGMNKEHSFPKSWWGGHDNGDGYDAYSDLHHLVPSDGPANTAKSNWPLGEVYSASFNNEVSKVGQPVTGQGGGASKVFEPDDEYKGDFARMYFYVATIYQEYDWDNRYLWMIDYYEDNWKVFNNWSVNLLLKWAREDPVSEKEINRNDAVFRRQNNRNPFIDDSELCEYIWGNRAGQAYDPTHGGEINPDPEPDPEPRLITPTQGTLLDFGDVKLGDSSTLTLYVKGADLTGNLTLQLYRYDYKMFSIPTTSLDYTEVCTETGYPLEVTYTPTALGDHRAKLLFLNGGLVGSVGVDIQAHCVENTDVLIGDLNGDGTVDVSDVNILINIILNKPQNVEIPEDQDPDITGEGYIDVSDVNMLINIILNKI